MLPKSIKLKPIGTPNYILLEKKLDNGTFEEITSVHLSEVDAETLSNLCDAWRKEVFKKAKKTDPKFRVQLHYFEKVCVK